MSHVAKVGVLYSTEGPYASIGRDCRDGAHLGIAHARTQAAPSVDLQLVSADPRADLSRYLSEAQALLRDHGCRHIIGTITSAARKEIIPLVEKHDALLWYVCPYEGFEANESVIYTGPCPNQHLLPMLDYVMPRFGHRAYLIGANYVWGWETNRLARQLLHQSNGEVTGERYLPMDETDVDRVIADIRTKVPDFILNNLVGPSSHAFLRAYHELGRQDPRFHPSSRPVVSCNLTECELGAIGSGIAEGNLSVASYFASLGTPENRSFRSAIAADLGPDRSPSAFLATTYATARLVAEAITLTGTDDPVVIRSFVTSHPFETILGRLAIDHRTNHASLPAHVGRISLKDTFDIVMSHPPVVADPYLAHPQGQGAIRPGQDRHLRPGQDRHLRIVS